MTIEEAVATVRDCLRAGVAERLITLCLVEDGFKPEKVRIILRWAKMPAQEVTA